MEFNRNEVSLRKGDVIEGVYIQLRKGCCSLYCTYIGDEVWPRPTFPSHARLQPHSHKLMDRNFVSTHPLLYTFIYRNLNSKKHPLYSSSPLIRHLFIGLLGEMWKFSTTSSSSLPPSLHQNWKKIDLNYNLRNLHIFFLSPLSFF